VRREHRARESRCPARALPATCVSPPTGTLVRLTAPTGSEWAGVPRASVTRRVAPCPGARVVSLRGHNRGGCGVPEPDCFSSTRCTSPPPPDLDLPSDDDQECGITARFMNNRQSRCTQTTTSRRRPRTRDDGYTRARVLPLRRRERAWSSPRLGRPRVVPCGSLGDPQAEARNDAKAEAADLSPDKGLRLVPIRDTSANDARGERRSCAPMGGALQ
jgi:hypothetical protein